MSRVSVTARDGAVLRGWWYQPGSWNGNSVLVMHGVSDNRESGVGVATLLLAHGYRVLTPDARAQGESGGELATYGLMEKQDIGMWVAWLRSQQRSGCIHGLGYSMGAAHLIQANVDPSPFCDVVAESSFATFREVGFDRVGQAVETGPWLGRTLLRPAVEAAFLSARLRYHVDLGDANPSRALQETTTPVLIVHSLSDENIPVRHAYALAASKPERVSL
ncbi:MAG TPA: alpha/beta hydrolase [Vicinamibacterales bacterium]|nr:alpha/beta hydrolase [Vicinamibacterales bacterium]